MKLVWKIFFVLVGIHIIIFYIVPKFFLDDGLHALEFFLWQCLPAYTVAKVIPGMVDGNLMIWPTTLGYVITILFWVFVYGLLAKFFSMLLQKLHFSRAMR